MRGLYLVLSLTGLLLLSNFAGAKGVYQSPHEFLQEVFGSSGFEMQTLWLDEADKQRAQQIFGRKYMGFRMRYWQHKKQTAWIFDEVGKTRPITFGVVVADNKVESLSVLEFRESRGGEIRHPFFTQQFVGLGLLKNSSSLDDSVDGITGATLSVRAATRIVRFALYLAGRVDADRFEVSDE